MCDTALTTARPSPGGCSTPEQWSPSARLPVTKTQSTPGGRSARLARASGILLRSPLCVYTE